MAIGGRAWALPLVAALTLWSGDAAAVVLPPCSTLFVHVAPAPIEARDVAVYLHPNGDGGGFSLQWLDAEGAEVPFELFVPGTSNRIYLRPSIAIAEGAHTLVYSDDCTAQDSGPVELPLAFVTAPPPPPADQLGELVVQYDPYCPGEPSAQGPGRYYPTSVSLFLQMNPALEPYAPFLHISVRDDTGTIDSDHWNVAWATGFSVHAMARCGSWSPSLPTGTRTFMLDAEILDGTRYDTLSAVTDIECPECEPAQVPSSGGSGGMSAPSVDAGREPAPPWTSDEPAGACSVASVPAGRAPNAVLALLVALVILGARLGARAAIGTARRLSRRPVRCPARARSSRAARRTARARK